MPNDGVLALFLYLITNVRSLSLATYLNSCGYTTSVLYFTYVIIFVDTKNLF